MAVNRKYASKITIEDLIDRRDAREPGFKARVETRVRELGIARQIKALREKRGFSQQEVADRADTAQTIVARLEAGHVPKLDLLVRIAFALDADLFLALKSRTTRRPAAQH